MDRALQKMAGDAEKIAADIRTLISECRDYELQRLLKKLDAEVMDMRHNIQLAIDIAQRNNIAR